MSRIDTVLECHPAAVAASQALGAEGEVYVVGGAVRDLALNREPADIDLLVRGIEEGRVAELLSSLPGRCDLTGRSFGVFRYRSPEDEVEVALPRTELSTGPGHKDFEVTFDPYAEVETDLERRDFTVNAMAMRLPDKTLLDPFGGHDDLREMKLRPISKRSFVEDPLRILRALSMVSRHQFIASSEAETQMAQHAESLRYVSMERVQIEMDKIIGGNDPRSALVLAQRTGVLRRVLPNVAATYGFDQKNKWHKKLLFDHLLDVLHIISGVTNDLDLRWTALLHDIGKPASQWVDEEGQAHYYRSDDGRGHDHEIVGAISAAILLGQLRFPNDRIDRISSLIRWHMYPPFGSMRGARRYLNKVGPLADDLLTLRWADSGGKDKGNPEDGSVKQMRELIQRVRESRQPTDVSQLSINGDDLIAAGFTPGPQMGEILRHLVEAVLEDPVRNSKEELLSIALDYGKASDA